MPKVVPSQIVEFIDSTLPEFLSPTNRSFQMHPSVCGALNALLRLLEQLPDLLLPRDADTYALLLRSEESLRYALRRAQEQDHQSNTIVGPPILRPDGNGEKSQVQIIHEILLTCPDEILSHHSKELQFIQEPTFRDSLLIDLEATRSALHHAEWKAATVLAGSLIESLLLWAIQQQSVAVEQARGDLVGAGRLRQNTSTDPLNWGLHEFVEVAEKLSLIQPDSAKQARLAKDFRNLIHPGRTIRTQQSCGRGTALAANAAVELVLRDLQARFG